LNKQGASHPQVAHCIQAGGHHALRHGVHVISPRSKMPRRLELERLGHLPSEVRVRGARGVAEMAIGSGLLVLGLEHVELTHKHAGAAVEVGFDDLEEVTVGAAIARGAVRVDEDGERGGDTDGVRELHNAALAQLGRDQGLGDPAAVVCCRAVHLGGVLAREGTATVRTPAAVRVDDDLAAGETAVTLGAADNKAARGVQVVDGLIVEVLGGHDSLDHLLLEVGRELRLGVGRVVLGGNNDGVHAQGGERAVLVLLVLNSDLRLAVGAEQGQDAFLAHLGELVAEAGRERVGEGHHLLGFVGRVAEHVALVTGADVLGLSGALANSLADLDRLAVELVEHLARLVVEALLHGVETNLLDGIAHDLLVVDLGVGGDLAEHHHEARAGARLAGDARLGVLREAGVHDRIRDLVRELVGVALVYGLRGEQELALRMLAGHCCQADKRRGWGHVEFLLMTGCS
jgi:hypothetical protein